MGKHTSPLPTQARLRELLDYDPATGILTWKIRYPDNATNRKFNARFSGKRVGTLQTMGYESTTIDGGHYRLHRIIWKWMTGNDPVALIDHINRQRNDNRWANLQEATYKTNYVLSGWALKGRAA